MKAVSRHGSYPAFFVLLLLAVFVPTACGGSEGAESDAGVEVDAADGDGDASPGGSLDFMSECDTEDDRCDSAAGDTCFLFNNKGPRCTHACTTEEMCPAPSGGCGNQGVCRPG